MSFLENSNIPFKARVSLLEERLASYDEISKQMLSKLEQAVEKISESNSNISQILIRHEERIDRASEASTAILELIGKTEKELKEKIGTAQKSSEDNKSEIDRLKNKSWLWAGIVMASSFFISQFRIVDMIIQQDPPSNFYAEQISPKQGPSVPGPAYGGRL